MNKAYVKSLKKILSIAFAIILGLCSFACDLCPHYDSDSNGKCDICNAEFSGNKKICATCGGEIVDGKCDICDKGVTEEKKCDTCGGALIDGECETCDKPNVEETKCGTCGGVLIDGKCEICDKEEPEHMLNGKKIMFIGNSYTYYGQTVLEQGQTTLRQSDRSDNKGYFHQLCKANGADVKVTNWTFGGHSLEHLFSGNCSADRGCDGKDHASYLTDRNYDYVVIQAGNGAYCDSVGVQNIEMVMDFFKAGNPDTKFILLIPYSFYGDIGSPGNIYLMKNVLNSLKTFASQGAIIVEWGSLVIDIMNKNVQVPNSTIEYSKNTFVVAKSETDGYHPNLLSGYITTLMTYCAITGESAQGQTYAFCNDSSLRPSASSIFFNFSAYKKKYYTEGTTNFDKVFASQNDMQGIQGLIDSHLAAKAYMNYNY